MSISGWGRKGVSEALRGVLMAGTGKVSGNKKPPTFTKGVLLVVTTADYAEQRRVREVARPFAAPKSSVQVTL
jgi:hypothetical protein